jgi:hypothetical protein
MKIFIGLLAAFSLLTGTVSAQTAYQDDETDFYVENQANEALAFVNMLICYMRSMAPDKMVNKGPYIANTYADECEATDTSSDQASATPTSAQSASNAGSGAASGSEKGGGHTVEANAVTVTRADNNSPMMISAWVNQEAEEEDGEVMDPAVSIFVKGTQTTAPSASSKFGTFSMDATYLAAEPFMGMVAKGDKMGGMRLEADGSTVKFRDQSNFGPPEALVATFNSDGVSGIYNAEAFVPYGGDYAMLQVVNQFAITDSGKAYCTKFISAKRLDYEDRTETGAPKTYDYTPTGSDGLTTDEVCFSTAIEDAKRNVWRYGVYKADGSRYELGQGGFPMKAEVTVGSATETVHAWGDYWGVHVDDRFASAVKFVGDSSPTTFTKEQFAGESGTPPTYQIKQAHSRISKISKTYVALDSLDKANVVMWVDKWDTNWSGKYNTLGFTGSSGEYSGTYTASSKTWTFDKKITFTSGYNETTLGTPISFTNATWVSTMQKSYGSGSDTWTDNRNLWLWSRDEGKSYEIGKKSLENPTDSSSTNGIAVESSETLTPKDFPSSLFCVEQCPTAAKLTATVNAAKALGSPGGTVVSPYDANNWQILQSGSDAGNQFPGILSSNVQTYTITGVQVKDSTGNEVMFAADIVNPSEQLKMANFAWPWGSTGELQWGVRTGKLFATQADLDKLECEKAADSSYRDTHPVFNASAKRYCPDTLYSDDSTITTWYEISFGANPWDRQKFLVDQSTSQDVVFTPPVTLYYDVPNETKYGEDKGKKIRLEYNGFGELQGVPGEVVDTTTGESLGQYITEWKEQYRYVQRFVLENDASGNPPTVSTGGASPTTYKVKALQGDEWLTLKPSVKGTLNYVGSVGDLPAESVLVEVHPGATGGGIGVEPTTGFLNAGKAAVIHGDKVIAD